MLISPLQVKAAYLSWYQMATGCLYSFSNFVLVPKWPPDVCVVLIRLGSVWDYRDVYSRYYPGYYPECIWTGANKQLQCLYIRIPAKKTPLLASGTCPVFVTSYAFERCPSLANLCAAVGGGYTLVCVCVCARVCS